MNALILKVMDRKYSLNVSMISVLLEMSIKEHGHHTRLPVITVKDIGLEAHEVSHEVKDRSLEETVSLDIEYILYIDLIEIEVILIIYKIEHGTVLLELKKTCIERSPAHMDHLPSEELELALILDLDLTIQRKDDSCVYLLLVKFYGKSSHYVSKTAYLDKRAYLRRNK